jgi:hypothetical protein
MKKILMVFLILVLLILPVAASGQSYDSRDIALNKHNMKSGWTKVLGYETVDETSRFFTKDWYTVRARVRILSSEAEAVEIWEEEIIEGYLEEGGRPAPTIAVDAYGRSLVDLGEWLVRVDNIIMAVNFDFDDYPNTYNTSMLKCEKVQVQRIADPGRTALCPVVPD